MIVSRLILVPAAVCVLQATVAAQSLTLTLADALAQARAQAPSVLVARARIEESRGRLAAALIRYRDNPIIDGAAGPRATDAGTLTDVDVGIMQVFETGGQRRARVAGAEAAIQRETATAADVTRLALRDVAFAWFRTLHAQERIVLLTRTESVATEVITIANRRYTAGDIAILDVNVSKSAFARARAARMAAEAERAEAAGELQRLLGLPRGEPPIASGALTHSPTLGLTMLIAAVDQRSDIQALRADIADAEADIRLGRAANRPDIGVGARVKHEEGDLAVVGQITVALPAFSHGQELVTTGTARASRLRLELETTRNAVVSEIESLYRTYMTRQIAAMSFERDALAGLDENEALAQRSFDVGQISLPELLLVRRELVDTRLDYLDRLLEASEAAIALEAAAGVLR
jgi:outer membrane protein, heavy metal efflux system